VPMPDDKRGGRSSGPALRPISASRPPPQIPSMGDSDLPLPSDRRAGSSFKAFAPVTGALAEKLQEWKEAQLPEEQLIQFHRTAFGALAALLALQALAPTAVPSLWWAFISQPLILQFPSNVVGGFWYVLGVTLWLSYGAYHVTQGALLSRTRSGWPWSPMQTLGFALIPLYNVYGSWVLFKEAFTRLGAESEQQGRVVQARSALLGAMLLILVTWGLQLASDLGLEIPDIGIQSAAWARAAAELATLGLAFSMMRKVIHRLTEEGGYYPEEGEEPSHPLSRGPSGPASGLTIMVLMMLLIGGITIYYSRREALECPLGASLTTTAIGSGQRALYCAKDGFPEGPWRVRTKAGVEQFSYRKGEINGEYRSWYPGGQLRETGAYFGKKKAGQWTYFSETGVKLEEVQYSESLKDGISVKYFANGKVAEQRNYTMGKLNGKFTAFHENGAKAEQGEYKDGNKVGHWSSWNPSGLSVEEKDYTPVKGDRDSAGTQGAPGSTETPGTPGTQVAGAVEAPAPAPTLHEVTEQRFFAGRTPEWWGDRLTRLKQRVQTGDLEARVYDLTKRRAQLNGLEVMDAQSEVKVRVALTASAPPPQGGGKP